MPSNIQKLEEKFSDFKQEGGKKEGRFCNNVLPGMRVSGTLALSGRRRLERGGTTARGYYPSKEGM